MIRQPYMVGQGYLEPEDHEARAQLAGIPVGERVEIVIIRERPQRFENLAYLTFRLVGNAMHLRERNARGWLAIKTGRCEIVLWPPSELAGSVLVPHGTGPSDMGRAQLEAFWDEARVVIQRDVLPFVAVADAEQIGFRIEETQLAALGPSSSR